MRTYEEHCRVYYRRVLRALTRSLGRDLVRLGMRQASKIAADAVFGRRHAKEFLPDDIDLDLASGWLHCGMLAQVRFAALADR